MMIRRKLTCAALSLAAAASLALPVRATALFTDVSGWAQPYVEEARARGLVEGAGDGLFYPDRCVTCSEFAALLTRAFFPEQLEQAGPAGEGVPWYAPCMTAAGQAGLFRGTAFAEEGADPTRTLTRTEMAQMIANTLQTQGVSPLTAEQKTAIRSRIPDLACVEAENQDAVLTVYAFALLTGTDAGGTFSGQAPMTRAQAATVLVRMEHLREDGYALSPIEAIRTPLAQGPFDVPIAGAMGYALADTGSLKAGSTFTILGEEGENLQVLLPGGTRTAVPKTHAMVNVPDVIPSLICRNVNAQASQFHVLGMPFPSITGTALYTSRGMNLRLGREEFFMPLSYSMAVKLNQAQKAAMNRGLSLVLYEGYRPAATQQQVSATLTRLRGSDPDVRAATSFAGFNPAYYVNTAAGGIGSHQRGTAVDISLATVETTAPLTIGGTTVQVPLVWTEFDSGTVVKGDAAKSTGNPGVRLGSSLYSVAVRTDSATTMPTPITETSYLSGTFQSIFSGFSTYSETAWRKLKPSLWWTRGAQVLQDLMVGAGLTPLASEWWHFNDVPAYQQMSKHLAAYPNLGSFSPVESRIMSTSWETAVRLTGSPS